MSRKYKVIVTSEAQAGIRDAFLLINGDSPANAAKWLRQLYRVVDSLERFPERCAFALERDYLQEDLRQLAFKSHRLVFRVDKDAGEVFVLFVRHASRRAVGEPADDEE